jgi:hypothetical protein
MMELLMRIPENVGWMIDGALAVVLAYALVKVVKLIAQAWREWHEDDDEEIFEES